MIDFLWLIVPSHDTGHAVSFCSTGAALRALVVHEECEVLVVWLILILFYKIGEPSFPLRC